jgi:hypothetical protein
MKKTEKTAVRWSSRTIARWRTGGSVPERAAAVCGSRRVYNSKMTGMNDNARRPRRAIPFTQASITRAVQAVLKAGLLVKSIDAASGMVHVQDPDQPLAIPTHLDENQPSKWDDVEP